MILEFLVRNSIKKSVKVKPWLEKLPRSLYSYLCCRILLYYNVTKIGYDKITDKGSL